MLMAGLATAIGGATAIAITRDSGNATSDRSNTPEGVLRSQHQVVVASSENAVSVPEFYPDPSAKGAPPPSRPRGRIHGIPAQMLDHETPPPFPSAILLATNGWSVGDGKHFTIVWAGASARNLSDGLFGILRTTFPSGRQRVDYVKAPGLGSLRITRAPIGKDVETKAQRGQLRFQGENGESGRLNLRDDSIAVGQ